MIYHNGDNFIIVVFSLVVSYPVFAVCVYRMWDCFVRSVETSHLGPLLSHVIVALLPLIPLQPKETAAIIRFLIIDNRWESEHTGGGRGRSRPWR